LSEAPLIASRRLLGLAVAFYGGLLALALVWGLARGLVPSWWSLGIEGGAPVAGAAAAGIAMGFGGVVASFALERSVPGVRALGERFATILAGARVRDALLLAALSSLGEEALFRGCVQQELGFWPATGLFALVHTGPERVYLWWTATAFVFGIGLALLFEHQGGLLAPVLMHFVINAVNIRVLGRRGAEAKRRAELRAGLG
jgi:membrane protease YdiL (CAAX protease family)